MGQWRGGDYLRVKGFFTLWWNVMNVGNVDENIIELDSGDDYTTWWIY